MGLIKDLLKKLKRLSKILEAVQEVIESPVRTFLEERNLENMKMLNLPLANVIRVILAKLITTTILTAIFTDTFLIKA